MHYEQENPVGPTTHILSNLKYQTNANIHGNMASGCNFDLAKNIFLQ
jgi:hypothetical protein